MNERAKITLSEVSQSLAEKRARENGFESVSKYIDALIEDDRLDGAIHDWMRERINEGLASPSAGKMTATKLNKIIDEALLRVPPKA